MRTEFRRLLFSEAFSNWRGNLPNHVYECKSLSTFDRPDANGLRLVAVEAALQKGFPGKVQRTI